MRTLSIVVGVILILIGGFSLAGGGISWTQEETVMDVGPVQATAQTRESAALPPLAAGAVILVGVGAAVWGAVQKE